MNDTKATINDVILNFSILFFYATFAFYICSYIKTPNYEEFYLFDFFCNYFFSKNLGWVVLATESLRVIKLSTEMKEKRCIRLYDSSFETVEAIRSSSSMLSTS